MSGDVQRLPPPPPPLHVLNLPVPSTEPRCSRRTTQNSIDESHVAQQEAERSWNQSGDAGGIFARRILSSGPES